MRMIRTTAILVATILVLSIVAFALVKRSDPLGGDIIIIKGGSLEVICPKGDACLGVADSKGQYKHKTNTGHITLVEVKAKDGTVLYTSAFEAATQPQVEITYK
jgi:signal peptidase I